MSADPKSDLRRRAERARFRHARYRLNATVMLYPSAARLATLRAVARELLRQDGFRQRHSYSKPLVQLLDALLAPPARDLGSLEEEYVRLYRVQPVAPPYESVYRDPDGRQRGWIAAELEQEYGAQGLLVAKGDLPDHVAAESEFMACLCTKEALAWQADSADAARGSRALQYRFLTRHLGRWIGRFASHVKAANPPRLYRAALDAAEDLVECDLAFLARSAPADQAARAPASPHGARR